MPRDSKLSLLSKIDFTLARCTNFACVASMAQELLIDCATALVPHRSQDGAQAVLQKYAKTARYAVLLKE